MIIRNLKRRYIIVVLALLIFYGIACMMLSGRKFDVSLENIKTSLQSSAYVQLNTETCIFPKISNIEDLKQLFKKPPPLTCKYQEPDWVTCETSKCYVRKSILLKKQDVKCTFIDVMFNTDFGIYDGALKTNVVIYVLNKSDVVKVYCKSKTESWSSVLIGVRHGTNKTAFKYHSKTIETTTNVLIIGFPSVSRNTFIQKLPNSYQYLIEVLKGVVLKGYNAVGEGTLSSLYPMLTGHFRKEYLTSKSFYWTVNNNIDDHPFIWKDYQKHGYVTAFLEDFNLWASVENKLEGFQSMPTHHYIKPYYLAVNDMIRIWPKYCSGSVLRYKIFLDYIEAFFSVYKKRKKFLFAFHGELSYDNYNAIEYMDSEMLSFLRHMQTSNDLENTLLIIMSDQGYKFSTIKDTLQTKLEENLPFVYVRVPPRLSETLTYMSENLQRNAYALSTPFDLHVTLKNLLYKYYEENNNSYSLFRKFSNERTCEDAQIHPESCVCLIKKDVDMKSSIAPRIKKILEDTVNNITAFLRDKCVELTVFSVTNLTRVVPNQRLSRYKIKNDHYSILALMLPSYTLYSAIVLHDLKTDEISLKPNDITSHDFGLQSRCIKTSYPKLRKFCYCVNQSV